MNCPRALSGGCYCDGSCRRPCSHTFTWHGVIPPSHCPLCGAPLVRPVCPYAPSPPRPLPWPGPYYTNTVNVQQNNTFVLNLTGETPDA